MADRNSAHLQQQIDELVGKVATNTDHIATLTGRADASHARADATERRVDDIEARAAVDREIIAELQADGVLSREHVSQLEAALVSSRVIGTAVGFLMSTRGIGQDEALAVLKQTSQRTNKRMRDLAETVIAEAAAPR
ncbi:ANTAR domain-containing protein [Nocardioides xinjiangensis]|uniref:ANTAR domain-containing protein n=1 Tax=Nocardioides xinjiangensis TaxID=2817376 RepID=UPI001B30A3CB|nr:MULTISPECIES: ANTAR domain-containing protein [unclassified Nocardioides]